MKKSRLLIVLAGLAVVASGCGYSTGGEDSTVTVIEATPTPTPEPTPEVTPTPEATPTPAVEMAQTASGVNIIKQSGTYYAVEGVNIRSDCSTDADIRILWRRRKSGYHYRNTCWTAADQYRCERRWTMGRGEHQ